MNWPDYAILGTILISMLVGALRGFIKEVFSLVVWSAAFIIAYQYAGNAAALMEDHVSLPSARTAMGFTGLFVTVLLIGGLLNYLLGRLVESTGLTGTDRLLGGIFGAARGLVLVIAVLLVAGFTPIPLDPWWKESQTIQRMMPFVDWASAYLPEKVREHIDFEPEPEPDAKTESGPETETENDEEKDIPKVALGMLEFRATDYPGYQQGQAACVES